MKSEIEKLREQNAALLEACKAAFEMMDFYAGKPFPPRWAETMHAIQSAIAKATSHSINHNADQSRLNKGVE